MFKIKNLGQEKDHQECALMLKDMFESFGIKPLKPTTQWNFWAVKTTSPKESLLDEPILSVDEKRNEIRAVFFITRRHDEPKLKIFRITELFESLHENEKDVTIQEALDKFMDVEKGYIPPVSVVCLGKIDEDGKEYAGAFLYHIPTDKVISC